MAAPPELLEHVQTLTSHLAGKDPRRLKERARGTALLVLTDGVGGTHRVRIDIGHDQAKVALAGASDADDLTVVRARLADWLAFYHGASAETLRPLKFYGDPALMAALGELFTAQRSVIDLRAGGRR